MHLHEKSSVVLTDRKAHRESTGAKTMSRCVTHRHQNPFGCPSRVLKRVDAAFVSGLHRALRGTIRMPVARPEAYEDPKSWIPTSMADTDNVSSKMMTRPSA